MASLPLEDVRVLDFGTAVAGAVPGMLLADMGAQVFKVEAWNRADPMRFGPSPALRRERAQSREDLVDMRVSIHSVNRDKLAITLDLTTPEGREGIRELIKISDVTIDNFTVGVTQRLGLDYPTLKKIRPDIIAVSITMAGREGPWRDTRGYAGNMAGLGGLTYILGYADEPELRSWPFLGTAGDVNTGESAAMGILLALVHRQKTGEGQFIDLSASEASGWLLGEPIMDYVMNDRVAGHQGNYHRTLVPHGTYPCKGEDKWVSIAVETEEEWRSLCQATGNPHWVQDQRFRDKDSRMQHREELDQLIGEWTCGYTHYGVTGLLQKARVAAAPVLDILERYEDPHLRARGDWVEVTHSKSGEEILYNTPWNLMDTPGGVRFAAPHVGEHNDYAFAELLGLSPEGVARRAGSGKVESPRDLR